MEPGKSKVEGPDLGRVFWLVEGLCRVPRKCRASLGERGTNKRKNQIGFYNTSTFEMS